MVRHTTKVESPNSSYQDLTLAKFLILSRSLFLSLFQPARCHFLLFFLKKTTFSWFHMSNLIEICRMLPKFKNPS